jgi:hypothetical protein
MYVLAKTQCLHTKCQEYRLVQGMERARKPDRAAAKELPNTGEL